MDKKNIPILLLIIVLLLAVLAYLSLSYNKKKDSITDPSEQVNTNYSLKLDQTYISDNNWEYTVTGIFPNPCYEGYIEVIVRESYPEQVTVLVEVLKPNSTDVCAEVMYDFKQEGSFSASDKAIVELKLKE